MQRLVEAFMSKDDFLLRLVTVDEAGIHYYEPENKASSESSVGRAKEVKDTAIFWQDDCHSIFGRKRRYYDGLFSQKSTITGVYYANLLDQLRTVIREKVFCCNRTTRESTLAKLQWML